jgi:hypothetical protein
MSPFDLDVELTHDLDFRLVMNGFVTLFWRPEILATAVGWLEDHGYEVNQLDAAVWDAEAQMYRAMSDALNFPDYFGHNMNALNDCMRDVVSGDYGWPAEATGLVLVLSGYDAFAARCPTASQVLLDILADHGRSAALFGRRLLFLVQTNDPQIVFSPVGARPVNWNDAEWCTWQRQPN